MKKDSTFETEIGDHKFKVEIKTPATQANGSALVTYGETVVLATAVIKKQPREGGDYFPLMVDYEEKHYAAGRIIGSRFVKRENRPTEEAILVARLIDRTLRPLFDKRIRNDVQVIVTVLSLDEENDPDIPSLLAASTAVLISNIPWNGPIAGIRVGKLDGKLILNPSFEDRAKSALDLVVAGTSTHINMMEGGGSQVPEKEVLEAIAEAEPHIRSLNEFQKSIAEKVRPQKIELVLPENNKELEAQIKKFLGNRLEEALYTAADKQDRMDQVNQLKQGLLGHVLQEFAESPPSTREVESLFEDFTNEIVHRKALKEDKRPDGRKMDELRTLECEAGFLPRTHGSGLFTRGNTTALSVLTLGAPGDAQTIEGMEVVGKKHFMHHYNFPPFSVGEVGPMRGPGRREIGHGALAERSLRPIIPATEEFPYTIRLVSEILSSNGSSSMASVCGSTMALMDGGVPIREPAAGIAMGLMMEDEKNYKVLTDIQGPEDHHGDMDLKIAGTQNGITGLQMDVKIEGVTLEILSKTFEQAKKARLQILEAIRKAIPEPRPELSPHAPRILTIEINPDRIRDVIGPGGKIINEIVAETHAAIDIEDTGRIFITGKDRESAEKAVEWIKRITREVEVGEILEGKVVKITDFGAFVQVLPNQDGLVHISELAPYRVNKVEDILRLGDVKTFKVIGKENGKISLSLKQAQPSSEPPPKRGTVPRPAQRKPMRDFEDFIEK